MDKIVSNMIRDLGKFQRKDKKLGLIMDNLNSRSNNDMCRFYNYVDDKLYRKCKGKWKLYVPASISGEIIAEIHRIGKQQMYQVNSRIFYV